METIIGTFQIIWATEKLAYVYGVQLSCVYRQNIDSERKELFLKSELKLKSKFMFSYFYL